MTLWASYILLSVAVTILLIAIGFYAIKQSAKSKPSVIRKSILLAGGIIIWQVYIYAVASTGVLQNFDFPPRFFLLLVLPAFVFTGVFIYTNRNKVWIKFIPEQWLIYFQSFRIIVETLFVYTVAAGILHPNVTIEGYNFDMIIGFMAPVMAYLVYQRQLLSRKFILWWNYLGLAVLASVIFLFISSIYLPEIYGSKVNLMPIEFGTFPYVLVAGFLMPTAVFIHILSIVQLRKNGLTKQ